MSDAPTNEPVRLTPTQRLHEVTLAALNRPARTASEEVEIHRDAKGYRYSVAGVVGEAETLNACANRVLDVAQVLDDRLTFAAVEPEVEVSRNAKGDVQYSVKGDPHEVYAHAARLDETHPLSRKQNYDRDYTPEEK